jgi:hypothetical protein
MGISNVERMAWAEAALVAWRAEKGERGTDESDARDLVADLLHLLASEGRDIEKELEMARGDFDAEWRENETFCIVLDSAKYHFVL